MASLPPLFQCILETRNLAADDLLVSSLRELESPYHLHALETLLKRQNQNALAALMETYGDLPESCKEYMVQRVDLMEEALRAAIHSAVDQTRLNVIDVIARSGSTRVAYLLSMALHSTSSSVRGQAASALYNLTSTLCARMQLEESLHISPERIADYYKTFADLQVDHGFLVAALREALDSYGIHLRTAVVDSLGSMSLQLESELLAEAKKPQSKCWWAVMDQLEHVPKPSMATLALQSLRVKNVRSRMIDVLSNCQDELFMLAVMSQSWLLGDPEIRSACASIRRLSWLEKDQSAFVRMTPDEFRQTHRFVEATGIADSLRLQWYRSILLSDQRSKHAAALFGVLGIATEPASDVLRMVIDWADPGLAKLALGELLRRDPLNVSSLTTRYQEKMQAAGDDQDHCDVDCENFKQYWQLYDRMDEAQRVSSGRRLAVSDEHFVPLLADYLKSPNGIDRARAVNIARTAQLINRFKDRILECAQDSDRVVRSAAVKALSQLGARFPERLLTQALQDPDNRVRANAIEALDDIKSQQCVREITPCLDDPDHRVRAAAIKALLKLQVREAAESLLELLENPSRAHRISALWVIEKYGLTSLLSRVEAMAKSDPDEVVRRRAERVRRDDTPGQKRSDQPTPPLQKGTPT